MEGSLGAMFVLFYNLHCYHCVVLALGLIEKITSDFFFTFKNKSISTVRLRYEIIFKGNYFVFF